MSDLEMDDANNRKKQKANLSHSQQISEKLKEVECEDSTSFLQHWQQQEWQGQCKQ